LGSKMIQELTPDMILPNLPEDVIIRTEAREPDTDPKLGIHVDKTFQGTPRHRLVCLGDSITHGFQSGAIFNTSLAYPLLIAKELGCTDFRFPQYAGPCNGLPLNIEWLARGLETEFGDYLNLLELPAVLTWFFARTNENEAYWENKNSWSAAPPIGAPILHNLAVYGWDLCNTFRRSAKTCLQDIEKRPPKNDFISPVPEYANDIAALRVLNSARATGGEALTPIEAAIALGEEGSSEDGTGEGIETLIVLIGGNNALGSIMRFSLVWSGDDFKDMASNDKYTVWRPVHFVEELNSLVDKIKSVRARHVILGTVPHITICPFARGVNKDIPGSKARPHSRYYPYYTLPWISDESFDPKKHPHLTDLKARAIESAIDQYNTAIADTVRLARQNGDDWYLFDLAGLLDRLAYRRYIHDPKAQPSWWENVGGAYPLPPALTALKPPPDSRFFRSNAEGRTHGGLFSLDGIHPTTVGYGILAQELIRVMELSGVQFPGSNGSTQRTDPVMIDFEALAEVDTLINRPPTLVNQLLDNLGGIDETTGLLSKLWKQFIQ
jgi:hypothetical protein